MDVTWQDLHHSELTTEQLYALLALRNQVFIVEQNCAYEDIDGQDLRGENRHILGTLQDQMVACARILVPVQAAKPLKIGRVVVSQSVRGSGVGQQLMRRTLACCQHDWPQRPLFLSAQAHLQHFYGQFGFYPVSEPYLEDNILHVDMQNG
ncbi:GNAT family N-acetyltransferase [Erwinia sp. OLTSP20]|uniref:GNAT family N-acetyltransferase n=1 Tax=unclassified Erwinia TaxID=2622719 RepID=UPI000C1838ED|nr:MULTISPECIES: GNAT family N-acetyltransferase [unclassified Erwinia]PIJ50091.1 GNAT family N-acetyltransferase [Erwinia sp. OAMSP11]PIJ71961.1 GNAT family N-acetyltransferase [Erwinia sp. OLSSP12]PIJ80943.1 GNAT family N-acetyltransferase [Erwinia sp. OLCASP19]PIJ83848.1 GNAT family N-acetyltransferase [Erwinia sp. OLMTSP26]PIJ86006.1 GNAT family N-acetyltransferase [Erwinia sp. OLMDSP33]